MADIEYLSLIIANLKLKLLLQVRKPELELIDLNLNVNVELVEEYTRLQAMIIKLEKDLERLNK